MASKFTFSAGSTLPEQAESVLSALAFITRYESPLLTFLGFPGNLGTATNIKHEHMEDKLLSNTSTLNGAHTDSATTVNVLAGTGGRFKALDVIQFDGSRELIKITSVSTDALTVTTRGYRSTTAEAGTDGQGVTIVHSEATEGETAPAAVQANRSRIFNWTQIFRDTVDVTRSARLVDLLGGIKDEKDHQILHKKRELVREIAMTVYRGKVMASDAMGTSSAARTMDGLIPRIIAGDDPANVDASGSVITEDLLNTTLEAMFVRGGKPGILVAPPAQRRRLSALLQGRVRYAPEDSVLGSVVEKFVSDFGEIDVLAPDIFCPKDCILILDPAKVALQTLGGYPQPGDPFEEVMIGRTGLADKSEIVAELTLEMQNAGTGGHGLLQNLSFA